MCHAKSSFYQVKHPRLVTVYGGLFLRASAAAVCSFVLVERLVLYSLPSRASAEAVCSFGFVEPLVPYSFPPGAIIWS